MTFPAPSSTCPPMKDLPVARQRWICSAMTGASKYRRSVVDHRLELEIEPTPSSTSVPAGMMVYRQYRRWASSDEDAAIEIRVPCCRRRSRQSTRSGEVPPLLTGSCARRARRCRAVERRMMALAEPGAARGVAAKGENGGRCRGSGRGGTRASRRTESNQCSLLNDGRAV